MLKILLPIYVFLYQREPNVSFLQDDAVVLCYKLRGLIDSFDGVAEKFYSYFYALFLNNLLLTKFDDKTLTNFFMHFLSRDDDNPRRVN